MFVSIRNCALLVFLLALPAGAADSYTAYGLNFGPYINGQSPPALITPAQIRARLGIIASHTKWIRTYSSLNGQEQICPIAHEMGLKCAAGASLYGTSTDSAELASLIALAQQGYVDLAIVGTEVLLRGNLTPADLVSKIAQFRTAVPNVPVSTGETYQDWLDQSSILLPAVDIVFMNVYPFFENISVPYAISYLDSWYRLLVQAAGSKQVIVSETGWPSSGTINGAIGSSLNASSYFLNFVSWARANNVGYFYFEAFDEAWKTEEGAQGPHFGIWDQNGVLKPGMAQVFSGVTVPDNWTAKDLPGGAGIPALTIDYVQPYNPLNANTYPAFPALMLGHISHVRPSDYKVACYVYAASMWYVKPTALRPLSPLLPDGSWQCQVESQTSQVAAFLVPNGYNPPAQISDPPDAVTHNSIAHAFAPRTPQAITGTVVDANGQGVNGVVVSLSGSQTESATTSRGGFFAFSDLSADGNYVITPSAAGTTFSPASRMFSNISGSTVTSFATTSRPLYLSGQIADSSGNALSGVRIAARGTSNITVVTDAFGNYSFPALPLVGGYTITPAKGAYGFSPSYQTVSVSGGYVAISFVGTASSGTTGFQNVGFFQPSGPVFALDANGNGQWDGPAGGDKYFAFAGQPGAIAVTGDWNGDGRTKVGFYLNGFWALDYNGNGVWDGASGGDKFYALGGADASYVPVTGDWSGDGKTKIGFYRNGFWALDLNGNGTFDAGDAFYALGGNGAGEVPIVGDWNRSGTAKIGFYYNGVFALDYDGDGLFTTADRYYTGFSYQLGDRPMIGDWNSDGRSKIGVYRGGFWVLDFNGNGVYDGIGVGGDKFYGFGGNSGETPLVGDWNGDGTSKVGFYVNGFWALDFNGNGNFDGTGTAGDRFIALGGPSGYQPITGRW